MAKGLQKAKIVITGKNGQLGREFVKLLSERHIKLFAFDKTELDISNLERVRDTLSKTKPDFLINCAAYNLVDKAEEEKEQAYLVNSKGVKNLAITCKEINCKIVHYSTDYVFDGKKKSPYIEKDMPNPLNFYGTTKLEGENSIKGIIDNHLIFRVSWLYGSGKNNFISKFLNWSKENRELKITENEVSIPTSARRVADISLKAMEKDLIGLFHLTNSGYTSRYGLALKIKELMNLDNTIIPVKQSHFKLKAKRPEFSAMDNSSIQKHLDITIPHWEEDLKEFLKEIK